MSFNDRLEKRINADESLKGKATIIRNPKELQKDYWEKIADRQQLSSEINSLLEKNQQGKQLVKTTKIFSRSQK